MALRVPFWCPQCNGPMKGKSNTTFYKWKCCYYCFLEFIEGREQRWLDGWRPSAEDMRNFEERWRPSIYNSSKLPNT
jgi:hypothetical protein